MRGSRRIDIDELVLDILITADNTDLNVYKTAAGGATDSPVVGCCGPASKQGKSSCGGGGSGSSNSKTMGVEAAKAQDIDLNEWAGTSFPFPFLPS